MKAWQLLLLILAAPFLLMFAEDKKPALIPGDIAINYWRTRAIMMDDRLDKEKLFGAGGRTSDWNTVLAANEKSEKAYMEAFNAARAVCPIDMEALTKDKVLKCAKP